MCILPCFSPAQSPHQGGQGKVPALQHGAPSFWASPLPSPPLPTAPIHPTGQHAAPDDLSSLHQLMHLSNFKVFEHSYSLSLWHPSPLIGCYWCSKSDLDDFYHARPTNQLAAPSQMTPWLHCFGFWHCHTPVRAWFFYFLLCWVGSPWSHACLTGYGCSKHLHTYEEEVKYALKTYVVPCMKWSCAEHKTCVYHPFSQIEQLMIK